MAAQIGEGAVPDVAKKATKELVKISLDWSLPNGEVSRDITLKTVFFTKGGQAVCESSQPRNGKIFKAIPLLPIRNDKQSPGEKILKLAGKCLKLNVWLSI